MLWSVLLTTSFLAIGTAQANKRHHLNMIRPPGMPLMSSSEPAGPVTSRNGTVLSPYNHTYFFDQLIDHGDPSRGTFKQRFWHTWEFYEPGTSCCVKSIFGLLNLSRRTHPYHDSRGG
jgi:hypothetical protein